MLFILFFCVVNGVERGARPRSNENSTTDDYLDYDITPLLKNLTNTINDDEMEDNCYALFISKTLINLTAPRKPYLINWSVIKN